MKVLTTTGLSKLIELSKDTFVDKTDTTQVSLVTLANVATTGSYTDLSNKPTIPTVDQTYSASSTNAQSGTAVASAVSGKQDTITGAATTITSSNLTASKALVSDSSGKVAASSVTSTELGYVSGVTSAIQTQLNNKQATLVSGTNIKTINSTSLLGSGDISITGLPSQASQSGKYLTTNGTTASWANVPTEIPSQTGNSGKFLTTNGTTVSWANVDALPSQSGQSGKYLTTNGTSASWATIDAYTNGAGITISSNVISANCDTTTVSTNGSSKLQAIGVIDKKSSSAIYTWKGTKAEYDALNSYNNSWIYYITDDTTLPSETYYTKTQIDAMNKLNHTIEQDTASVILKDTNTSADITTAPSSAHNGGLVQFKDKNGETSGYVYTRYETNGDIIQYLESDKKVSGTVYTNKIGVGVKSNGTGYTYAPKPAASLSTSDTNIATVGWVNDPNLNTNVVHRLGSETISGSKTFSGNNTFDGVDTFANATQFVGTPEFISGDTQNIPLIAKNNLDDSTDYPEDELATNIDIVDINGISQGGWEHYHLIDGTYRKQMSVKRQGANEYAAISVSIDPDGQAYCNLPTDTYGTNFHGLSSRSMWADLAENYESDKKYPVGTLIRFGGEKDITIARINCNGVISDKPGYILDSDLENSQPVALVGKTPIRIFGKVKRFDRIVLDPECAGVGKVQTTSDEKVIAIALEASDDPNEKLVKCVTKFNLD